MFEWILVGVICAASIVMIAHTIDEEVSCTRSLRAQTQRCLGSSVPKEEIASRVGRGNDDEAQKRAA